MSTEVQTCICGSLGADAFTLRRCEDHHRYWLGDKELVSVSKILKACWPIEPTWKDVDASVVEHANDRGRRCDTYISQFITTGTLRIPAGEWREVVELVQKFVAWYSPSNTPVHTHVMLHDGEVAGEIDILDTCIWDLKTVYSLQPVYELQLGAYADLYESTFGKPPEGIGIIHLTKRYATPKVIPLDLKQCVADWRALRSVYEIVKRRTS